MWARCVSGYEFVVENSLYPRTNGKDLKQPPVKTRSRNLLSKRLLGVLMKENRGKTWHTESEGGVGKSVQRRIVSRWSFPLIIIVILALRRRRVVQGLSGTVFQGFSVRRSSPSLRREKRIVALFGGGFLSGLRIFGKPDECFVYATPLRRSSASSYSSS